MPVSVALLASLKQSMGAFKHPELLFPALSEAPLI